MSRPIGEPSVPLNQARQAYGTRQLQRRPALGGLSDFGSQTQEVFLPEFADSSNSNASPGVGWDGDAASFGGGYVTRATSPSDGDYFSFMSYFGPTGSVWSLRFLAYSGPDYGNLKTEIASLGYQLEDRPLGCPAGKIQDYTPAYGPALVYFDIGLSWNGYSASEAQPFAALSNAQLIVGGDLGDPLTDLTDVGNQCANGSGNDPQTLFPIMDGGPGWYRTKISVNGKSGSSSGFRFRVTRVAWSRVDDQGAV